MANLTFYYATMAAGKSTSCLQLNHSLKSQGFTPLLVKSSVDTRDAGEIKSRIGISQKCEIILPEQNIFDTLKPKLFGITHILVDEVQFLSKKQIDDLGDIVDLLNIDVVCFGLRTSYTGELFESSSRLFAIADNIIELPLMYKDGNKCIMHLRIVDGNSVFSGSDIVVGGDEVYKSVSRSKWKMEKNKHE